MTSLYKLLPKRSSFDVVFNDGRKKTLWLRPFTLRDEAYFEENYKQEDLERKFLEMSPRFVAQVVWRQLEPDSRKLFKDVKVLDENDNVLEVEDYEKFMASFGGVEQIAAAYNALLECRGLNSIMDQGGKKKVKKPSLLSKIIPSFLKR